MDIEALSAVMTQSNIRQQAAIQIASKVMDVSSQQSESLIQMMNLHNTMEQSVTPYLGGVIDIRL